MHADPLRVIVGSNNPVKIGAVATAFRTLFPDHQVECAGMHAPSGVAAQPMNEEETRLGARNRVHYCARQETADFYVALEGGVDRFDEGPATFAYAVISDGNRETIGRSASLPLPDIAYQALLAGEELGDVMDRLFGTHNIKQKGGAIGLLTNGHATRESIYAQTMLLAMAPFLHPTLYLE
ncbi:inosine/xanthosine triphosphatase [Aliiglaciecola sp. CAU 1673]|uniref:inosine/xanthosine triphosphatase n=1 Tax=Aliiglaciecola sp. CAU 1673 TaxID=3032595 RepID=UPI0023DAD6DA|nr:inosine/xanthosine triphosphatase [Aliiglaciecola sp. CAU 1673]MDF2178382.1 inosine/xanthosine triphosphatase [Aliiglaciecola sp. CAU 1673]